MKNIISYPYRDKLSNEKLVKKIYPNGDMFYYNSKKQLHRTDGPAVEYSNGSKLWFQNDKLHRTDGPAIEHADGTKSWYINDKLHRIDGPACEYVNGSKEWYINGKQYTELEFNIQVRKIKIENL